eukprot:c762_g1_i1 orf=21-221(+)
MLYNGGGQKQNGKVNHVTAHKNQEFYTRSGFSGLRTLCVHVKTDAKGVDKSCYRKSICFGSMEVLR